MLVVTRRKGQRIIIGNDIEVVVTGISGSTVRLAVVAPRSVPVLRGEVYEAVLEQNKAAARAALDPNFDPFGEMGTIEALSSTESADHVNALPPGGVSRPTGK
jgi:carbon storage regulator